MFSSVRGNDIPERTGMGGVSVSKSKQKGERMVAFFSRAMSMSVNWVGQDRLA
jgi:hypothetical protein